MLRFSILKPVALATFLALSGCAIGPDYHRPVLTEQDLPTTWRGTLPHAGQPLSLISWWGQFESPLLSALITAAQSSSPSVAEAAARVKQARIAASTAGAAYSPQVQLSASRSRASDWQANNAPVRSPQAASLDFSWELDLYGGGKRETEAAVARTEGAQANWHNARISLAAEVASTVLAHQKCRSERIVGQQEQASRLRTLELVRLKEKVGLAAPTDVAKAEAAQADSAANLALVTGTCERQINALVALTGLAAADLENRFAREAEGISQPQWGGDMPIPAKVLSQRPDVRAAEQALVQASANIGVAKADYLPTLSLRGTLGRIASPVNGGLAIAHPWSFGPALVLPLLDGGRRSGAIQQAEAKYEEAFAAYRSAVRRAVQEGEDAVSRTNQGLVRKLEAQRSAQRQADNYSAAEKRHAAGLASGLDLEEARRLKLQSELTQLNADLEAAQGWVALYKALGGGWSDTDEISMETSQ